MNLKGIFGATFFSCLAALILYDLIVKSLIAKVIPANKYDNTYDPSGEIQKNFYAERRQNIIADLKKGQEFRA